MIGRIRARLALLTGRERTRWALLLPVGALAATLEAVAAVAVYWLVAVLSAPALAATLPFDNPVAGPLARIGGGSPAVGLAIAVAGLHLFKNVILLLGAARRATVAGAIAAAVSRRALRAYLAAPYVVFLRRSSSELSQNLVGGVPALLTLFDSLATLLTEALVVAGLAVVLLNVAPGATAVATLVIVGPLLPFVRMSRSTYARLGAQTHEMASSILRRLGEAFGAIKEVKVFGREQFFYDQVANDHQMKVQMDMRRAALEQVPRLLTETAFVLGMLTLVVVLNQRPSLGGTLLPFVALYAYAGFRIIPAAHRIVFQIGNLRYGLAVTEGLVADLASFEKPRQSSQSAPVALRQEIRLDTLSYSYDGRGSVLNDIDLVIRKGESIGIVGATGAGKSTLIDLILGLLRPTSGDITVDGVSITRDPRAWQQLVGYVPQSPFVLDDTLRRNIAFGLPPGDIDEGRVRAAAALAQLDGFVSTLPQGLDTVVGERGVALSGGERQRLSIARAVYHDPDVLIFDEATSSLDPGTERELARSIERLKGQKTVLVIAHRLTTVERCDRVVVLRQGRVVADGPCDELMRTSEPFRSVMAMTEPGD
jgi:ATP-binding cassette subfamily C protein